MAQKVAAYYSEEIGARIEIEALEIQFFDRLKLSRLYVEDQNQDTLLYLNQLNLKLSNFNLEKKKVSLSLNLEQANFSVHRFKTDDEFNYRPFVDYFSSEESSSEFEWEILIQSLHLSNSRFSLQDDHFPDSLLTSMDYSHFDLSELELKADDIAFRGDTIWAKINRLSVFEKKGFKLINLSTDLLIHNELLAFRSTSIQTEHTDYRGNLSFVIDNFKDFSNFVHDVFISSTFESSLIHSSDLAFFVPALMDIDQSVYLQGKISGTIDHLQTEEIEIHLNKHTYLIGETEIRGLPDIEQTFIHLDLNEFQTTAQGLRGLPYPPFSEKNGFPVPEQFDRLGKIFFSGKFTGFYNDFVAFGELSSALGKVQLDLSLKEKENHRMHYSGQLHTKDFQFGQFLDEENLGALSLNLNVKGSGLSREEINAHLEGTIEKIEFKAYSYHNLLLNGDFMKERFDGQLSLKDENLEFDFLGAIDLSKSHPASNFSLNVQKALLSRLNLFNQKDDSTRLQFKAGLKTKGNRIDQMSGRLRLDSVYYSDSEKQAFVEYFFIENEFEGKKRSLKLSSSLVDGEMKGIFLLKNMEKDLRAVINKIISEEDEGQAEKKQNRQDFEFFVDVKDSRPFTKVLFPDLRLDTSLYLTGSYHQATEKLKLRLDGKRFSYSNWTLSNLSLLLNINHDSARFSLNSKTINAPANVDLIDFFLQANLKNANLLTTYGWQGVNNRPDSAEFTIDNHFYRLDSLGMQFKNSYFTINNQRWQIPNDNQIWIDTSGFKIHRLSGHAHEQSITLNGSLSNKPEDSLNLKIVQFNLEFLESFFPDSTFKLKGIANGTARMSGRKDDFFMLSDLHFDDLFINEIDFKSAFIKSKWMGNDSALHLETKIGEGTGQAFKIDGFIYPFRKEQSLGLTAHFHEFPITFFTPFTKGVVSDLQGEIDGNFGIAGKFSKPLLNGKLDFNRVKVRVDYLNTTYSFSEQLKIRHDFLGFDQWKIIDINDSKAIATGTVFHENYSDFNLDVHFEFEDFLSLNTNSKDNELFYGKGVTSGSANISGTSEKLVFDLDLTAGKGTDFKIPLGDEANVSNNDFIIFTNSDTLSSDSTKQVNLEGIQMTFNLKIEPEAKLQIIFDEQVGDILKARGVGNLKMEINPLGDFSIYGDYEVQEGSYLFTLQNVINKRFLIERGSKISWDGDPLRAKLDMTAIYETRAPLQDLFPADSNANFKRRIPVELRLMMQGFMLQPEISFSINLPTADDNIKTRLNSILYLNNDEVNRQEMNQQVFGLLVLNRFMPSNSSTSGSYSAGATGMNNGYEMLSNQLSNWVSNMSDQFDVGVNYRPSNEVSGEELDVSVSTELMDNRLILDGNFGYSDNQIQQNRKNSNFIGEFTVEYKLTEEGRLRLKAFNRSTNNSLLQVNSPYTQGVGVFYRKEFESLQQLWQSYFGKKKEEEEE